MADQQFDVFLCHNNEDKPAVIEIAQQLQHRGLRPWLDEWELPPGAIWQFALEQQIESIDAAAVFVGQKGLGPWQSEEIYAFLQEFIRRKCPVIPVLLPDAPQQPRLPIFLRSRHYVDFRRKNLDPTAQLVWGITRVKPQKPAKTAQIIDTQTVAQSPPRPTPTPHKEEVELKSEKGIDYARLQALLQDSKWREADQETWHRMLEAVGRNEDDWIRAEEFQTFPCADLKTIDALWTTHSGGKFGFSVQKDIWQQCGSPTDYDKDWDQFCLKVGWKDKKGKYLRYSELKANLFISSPGEFPCFDWRISMFRCFDLLEFSSLASRLVNCNR
ncbi:MAG: GUN4 domain-containing protein [Leptolyngbyaceae cyanobacterium]